MSVNDGDKCYAATPAETLEQHITDCRIAKNDAEWWAHHEILRIRAENEKLRAALKPFADKIDYCTGTKDSDYMDAVFQLGEVRAAAAALKETGDE